MPGWHVKLKDAVERGDVIVLGVTQEQHPDRCVLFAQWQQFDWPILHDPINLLGLRAVPVPLLIDEHGVVRDTRPRTNNVDAFLEKQFDPPREKIAKLEPVSPDLERLAHDARQNPSATNWRALGDAFVLWGGDHSADAAVKAYEESLKIESNNPITNFRLGVAHRMLYERIALANEVGGVLRASSENDFEAAVKYWGKALELDPNHYIYRRRIQQYGPRLSKPYPFYDWIERARADIRSRGETPVELRVQPTGAEIAQPSRNFSTNTGKVESPDPEGRITRDLDEMIQIASVLVPSSIKPGASGRIHVTFQPRPKVHWNNESEPLRIWLEAPAGWKLQQHLLTVAGPKAAESRERRSIEFEFQCPASATVSATDTTTLKGYALYYICEDENGQCLYRRQDFDVEVKLKTQK